MACRLFRRQQTCSDASLHSQPLPSSFLFSSLHLLSNFDHLTDSLPKFSSSPLSLPNPASCLTSTRRLAVPPTTTIVTTFAKGTTFWVAAPSALATICTPVTLMTPGAQAGSRSGSTTASVGSSKLGSRSSRIFWPPKWVSPVDLCLSADYSWPPDSERGPWFPRQLRCSSERPRSGLQPRAFAPQWHVVACSPPSRGTWHPLGTFHEWPPL